MHRNLLGLRMHMMPRAAPHMCAMRMWVGHVEQMSEISHSSRTTTVESNMKSEHNLYLACEDSPQRASFALSLVLVLPS